MNLFATDTDPVLAAQALDDKRVGKLLMEANQMLSLAFKVHCNYADLCDHIGPGMLTQGEAHRNHPVSKWVRATSGNWQWTFEHAKALANEFEHRFGKRHASGDRTRYIEMFLLNPCPNGLLLPFQSSARHNGLGLDFTDLGPITAYKVYLIARWKIDKRAPYWTHRGCPDWATEPSYNKMAIEALRAAEHPIYASS